MTETKEPDIQKLEAETANFKEVHIARNNYMQKAMDLTDRIHNSGSKNKEELWKTVEYFYGKIIGHDHDKNKASA